MLHMDTPVSSAESLENNLPQQPTTLNDKQLRILINQGFTKGLASALNANYEHFPVRFWIIDNSASMTKHDGHRIIETFPKNNVKIANCTRWEEIKECVNYHAGLSGLLFAPTIFKFLNDPGVRAGSQQLSVAEYRRDNVRDEQHTIWKTMHKMKPNGCTPLRDRILELYDTIHNMTNTLKTNGQKAVVVIATDGKPTDNHGFSSSHIRTVFIESLRRLLELPVWVVFRLCTDDNDVVEFYNSLDDDPELSIEVLDDFTGEAMEVYEFNPWLNYGLPLHRMRESGFNDRAFDFIDQRALTKTELRQLCASLFGQDNFDGVPDPSIDWQGFIVEIKRLNNQESYSYNPVKKKVLPWIDVKTLHKMYGEDSSCACVIM